MQDLENKTFLLLFMTVSDMQTDFLHNDANGTKTTFHKVRRSVPPIRMLQVVGRRPSLVGHAVTFAVNGSTVRFILRVRPRTLSTTLETPRVSFFKHLAWPGGETLPCPDQTRTYPRNFMASSRVKWNT